MAYLYRHIRLDKNEPFYIGIGEDQVGNEYSYRRAKSKHGRNNFWIKIVNKTRYEIEILEENLSWEEACEKEVWWIKFYGRADLGKGTLCNLTDGGDGYLNPSNIIRKRLSEANKGVPFTEERKRNISIAKKGKISSKEANEKISLSLKGRGNGRKISDELKAKISLKTKERLEILKLEGKNIGRPKKII